jgi:hypothetical protein
VAELGDVLNGRPPTFPSPLPFSTLSILSSDFGFPCTSLVLLTCRPNSGLLIAVRLDKDAQPRLLLCCCVFLSYLLSSLPYLSMPPPPPPPPSVPRLPFQFELVARPFFLLLRYNTRLVQIEIYSRGHSPFHTSGCYPMLFYLFLTIALTDSKTRPARGQEKMQSLSFRQSRIDSILYVYSSSRSSGMDVAPRRPVPPGLRVRLTASRWRLRPTPRSVSRILRWFSSISSLPKFHTKHQLSSLALVECRKKESGERKATHCDSCRQKSLAGAS